MSTRDGGAAFPSADRGDGLSTEGMALRDWFAGQALVVANRWAAERFDTPRTVAEKAYAIADAMLAVREDA